jgi:hypothetical protein
MAQRNKGYLPHFSKRAFMLLEINGPLLNSDKPIKIKNIRRNKNKTLFDFIAAKSPERIVSNKKKTIAIPAKVPVMVMEMGMKNITP